MNVVVGEHAELTLLHPRIVHEDFCQCVLGGGVPSLSKFSVQKFIYFNKTCDGDAEPVLRHLLYSRSRTETQSVQVCRLGQRILPSGAMPGWYYIGLNFL